MKMTKVIDVLHRDDWQYKPAARTDIRATFRAARSRQKRDEQEALEKVVRIRVRK